MQLAISKLLPTYFEKSRSETSEIWGKDLLWKKGEMIKIVAPSGSGKSSLINFLYGMRKDYEGNIRYDQHDLDKTDAESLASLRKDHISIVFQDLRLFPHQTVQENLEIKRQLNPYHPKEKIAEMAERLGIGKKLPSLARTCSYGEQQRVAIIRALMQPFDFLLLDEPFSHLDNRNSELAMQLMLEETRARQASIVFADLERIEFFPFTSLYHL
ncbi:ATP-binding cassette domain-containing protein [Terrimonas sp. NA20]|uniref:ATP-binding cassette domain-containing protein n=1 Tax=Terrimonas ginsenosidimutans TaxID=2908004 RepID=A0ABS9KVK9_9BACT|nr:ATP-binding cassette domain-containing protein [Terrimonas ginsenosidimutans]MCG2616361.1 ATP-binding cassette domain-containing protein [Terrimonas ginsenosidimutans]